MGDQEPELPRPDEEIEDRGTTFYERLGISEISYALALDQSIQHALLARPAPALPDRTWYVIGPRNVAGRVTALAQDPNNPLIIYAGTAHGGLWRTIDAGDTWEHLGTEEHNVPVGTIAIPPQDPTILYIGTGSLHPLYAAGRGLFRVSIPGPRTPGRNARFEPLGRAADGSLTDPPTTPPAAAARGRAYRYARIELDPDVGSRFWAASQTGLWRCVVPLTPVPMANPNAAAFTRDFPPSGAGAPAGIPALSNAAAPPPGFAQGWPAYATDVLVARDPRETEQVNGRARYLIVYVAIHGQGVFRGRYDRTADAIPADSWTRLNIAFPANFGRIRLAQCRSRPQHVYAVAADSANHATNVFYSDDNGERWTMRGIVPFPVNDAGGGGQADYDLILEVNPANPDVLACGVIDIAKSEDGGRNWIQIADWQFYDVGDYAQHADQHAALFDAADRRRLFMGNDGGLQMARDLRQIRAPGPLRDWRRRSFGIIAGQFQDVAVHPALPFLAGGGLQDNGSWASFGGPTWYRVGWADGGGFEFHAGNPRQCFPAQNGGFNLATVVASANPAFVQVPFTPGRNPIVDPVVPDVPTPPPGGTVAGTMEVRLDFMGTAGPFVPTLAEDPRTPGQQLLGSRNAAFAFWQPTPPAPPYPAAPTALPVALPAPVAANIAAGPPNPVAAPPGPVAGTECTAVAFGPNIAGQPLEAWLGSSLGHLLVSLNAQPAPPGTPFNPTPAALLSPNGMRQHLTRVTVHPNDPRIVAVAAVPSAAPVGLAITTAGAAGTAQFQIFLGGALFGPAINTGPAVAVPGSPVILTFGGPAGHNFVAGDSWGVFADGRVQANAGNTSTGTLTATGPLGLTTTIRITTAGNVGGPGAAPRFSYQIGGLAAVGGQVPAASFPVPGTFTILFFANGAYALNDSWTVGPNGTVTPAGANTSPNLSANVWFGGRAYLTYDRGASWTEITAPPGARPSLDPQSLPPGPMTSLAFDPVTPRSLFAGTLAGVYVLRGLPVPTAIAVASNPPAAGLAIPQGHQRQLSANVTLSDGTVQDWAAHVDWISTNVTMPITPTGLVSTAAAAVGATTNVTARRGSVVSPVAVVSVAAAVPGAPPAPAAPPAIVTPPLAVAWRPYNSGLPLTLVSDITPVPGSGRLRAATFGRGIYDVDLNDPAAPPPVAGMVVTRPVQLYIRQTLIEDGRAYPRQFPVTPVRLDDDPRLPAGAVGLDFGHAFDIRVDAPPFSFFDDRVDGVEFDEQLGADSLVPLLRNNVYVQVHNSGFQPSDDVIVHLYFIPVAAALPVGPPAALAPPLPATVQPALPGALQLDPAHAPVGDFYTPAATAAASFRLAGGALWREAGEPVTIGPVATGAPVVARFEWTVPAGVAGGNVALLAVCDAGSDHTWPAAPASVEQLIQTERRAALRIVPVGALPAPTIFIRDGVDDRGGLGADVRFGGRSPDIIVVQTPPAQPPGEAFRDLLDQRPQERLKGGMPNRIYVRVHNRGLVDTTAEVELWAVKIGADNTPSHAPGSWTQIARVAPEPVGPITVAVPAGKAAVTDVVSWTPDDPNPGDAYKAYLIVALVKTTDNADPLPSKARISTLGDFWNFLQRFVDAENAAARALRFDP